MRRVPPHGPPAAPSVERWAHGGEWVAWRGHRVFRRQAGSGPPLLLLHGVPGGSWVWHRVWAGLARRFRVTAVDLLGFGLSDKPPRARYDIDAWADLCRGVMGPRPFALLAHDHGDAIGLELLARGDLTGAVFLNGGVIPGAEHPPLSLRLMSSAIGRPLTRFLLRRPFQRNLSRLFGPDQPADAATLDALWRLTEMHGGRRVMPRLMGYRADRLHRRTRLIRALKETAVPVAFVYGAADPLDAEAVAAQWRRLRPDAAVEALPGVGHFPQLEAPEAVRAAAVRHLTGRGAGGSPAGTP